MSKMSDIQRVALNGLSVMSGKDANALIGEVLDGETIDTIDYDDAVLVIKTLATPITDKYRKEYNDE